MEQKKAFYRCDIYPNLVITVPEQIDELVGDDGEKVRVVRSPRFKIAFRGACLDLDELAKHMGLTSLQVDRAKETLANTAVVYKEWLEPGENIVCPICGKTCESAEKFRMHEVWTHGEQIRGIRPKGM